MQRFITLQCDTDMFNVFIWLHDGPVQTMRALDENAMPVSAIPLETIADSSSEKRRILEKVYGLLIQRPPDTDPTGSAIAQEITTPAVQGCTLCAKPATRKLDNLSYCDECNQSNQAVTE